MEVRIIRDAPGAFLAASSADITAVVLAAVAVTLAPDRETRGGEDLATVVAS